MFIYFFTVETLQDVLKEIDERFKRAENNAAVGSDDMSDVVPNKDDSAASSAVSNDQKVEVIMISDDETEDTSDSVFDSPPYSPKYGPDCNVFYSPASPTDPSE